MTTLFDAMLATAEVLQEVRRATATGGSVTTLIDTTCTDRDDYYNGGTIFFLTGNNIGKSAVVTDFAKSTGTFTFATQDGACAAANQYAATTSMFTRVDLVRSINNALASMGEIVKLDTSLTGASGTITYSLPTGVFNVKRVAVDGARNQYWEEVDGSIIFASGKEPIDTMTIWYIAKHAYVSLDADVISNSVALPRLAWEAAYYAALQRIQKGDTKLNEFMKIAGQMRMEMKSRYPIKLIGKDTKLATY